MVNASAEFANNVNNTVRKSRVSASVKGEAQDITVVGWSSSLLPEQYWQLYKGTPDAWTTVATMEPGRTILNGSSICAPDISKAEPSILVGWIADCMSGKSCEVNADKACLYYRLDNETVKHVSIIFDTVRNQYATMFDIEFYDASEKKIYTRRYTKNKKTNILWTGNVSKVCKIQVKIYSWSTSYSRPRILQLYIGFLACFAADDITDLKCTSETDIRIEKVPNGDCTIKLENTSGKYDALNEDNILTHLTEGQKVSINVAVGNRYSPLESILYSTQYLKSWTSGGTLKCENAIGKIKDIDLPVSITEHSITTAKQHADMIAYYIGRDLFDTSGISDILNFVNACESTSASENLRVLAEFECKTIVCTTNGKIQLKALGNNNAVYADYKHMYDKPEAEAEQLCGGVDVILYKYTYGERQDMKSVEIDVNGSTEYFIAFESPHQDVFFSAETLEGNAKVDEIYSGGSVGMTAYLSGTGKVKITPKGRPVLTEKKTISVNNPKASNKSANRITVDNPCVVTLDKARQIASYKLDIYNRIYDITANVVGDPRLEISDKYTIQTDYGNMSAILTKNELSFTASKYLTQTWEGKSNGT